MPSDVIKLLVVDDDPAMVNLISAVLIRGDKPEFELAEARDMKSCLEYLREKSADAILLDLNLPDRAGLETIKTVAADSPNLPIVVMTGLVDESIIEGVLGAGAQDYFHKEELSHLPLSRIIKYAIERKAVQIRLSQYEKELKIEVDKRTRQLEYAKLIWERTFDSLPDFIYIVDKDYNIIRANKAMARRIGVHPKEIVGRKCYEIMHGQDMPIQECAHKRTLIDGIGRSLQYKDPITDYDLLLTSSPLLDEDGEIIGSVEVVKDISPLKDVERALGDEVEKNQQILDSIATPVIVKDLDGMYTACNAAYAEYFGMSKDEVVGKSAFDMIDKISASQHIDVDEKVLSTDMKMEYEAVVYDGNGDARNVILYKSVLKNREGYNIGIVGAIVDITERKKVENALVVSDRQHKMFLHQLPVSTVIYDNDGKIIFCNSSFENTFGWTMDELVGRKIDFVPDEYKDQTWTKIKEMNMGKPLSPFETKRYTKHGDMLDVTVQSSPNFNENGEHVGNIIVIRDISEIKKAESERAKTERRYQTLVETMNEGLVVVDTGGYTIYNNPKFLEMTGYTSEELQGKHFMTWLDQRSRDVFLKQWEKHGVEIKESYELNVLRKDGNVVQVLASPKTMIGDNGEFVGAFAVISNITERKNLESQLIQAQKLESVGQLAAGIAHEINTPTQYVSNNNSFVSESFGDVNNLIDEYKKLVEEIKKTGKFVEEIEKIEQFEEEIDYAYLAEEIPSALSANHEGLARIATIVKSVKEFAHPGQVDKQQADINHAIQNTVSVARNEWKYVADVELDLYDGLPHIPCVVGEINQVILNLLVNAAHAIGELPESREGGKGKIKISSRLVDEFIQVTVEDNGPGIPDDVKDHIFDPFFTTKEPGKGTGQGLAISYRAIVDTHNGSLNVESKNGEGSIFTLRLPVYSEEKAESD